MRFFVCAYVMKLFFITCIYYPVPIFSGFFLIFACFCYCQQHFSAVGGVFRCFLFWRSSSFSVSETGTGYGFLLSPQNRVILRPLTALNGMDDKQATLQRFVSSRTSHGSQNEGRGARDNGTPSGTQG